MSKRIFPNEATIHFSSSKDENIFKIDCFLHLKDSEAIVDLIENYLKTECKKTIEFNNMFEVELDAVQNKST